MRPLLFERQLLGCGGRELRWSGQFLRIWKKSQVYSDPVYANEEEAVFQRVRFQLLSERRTVHGNNLVSVLGMLKSVNRFVSTDSEIFALVSMQSFQRIFGHVWCHGTTVLTTKSQPTRTMPTTWAAASGRRPTTLVCQFFYLYFLEVPWSYLASCPDFYWAFQ